MTAEYVSLLIKFIYGWNKLDILLIIFLIFILIRILENNWKSHVAIFLFLITCYGCIFFLTSPDVDISKPTVYSNGCHVSSEKPKVHCIFGRTNSNIKIALVGDSHAAQYFNVIREIADSSGYSMASWTKSSCPFLAPVKVPPDSDQSNCVAWQRNVLEDLIRINPRIVIIGNLTNDYKYTIQNAGSTINYLERFKNVISALEKRRIKTLVIEDFPKPQFVVVTCGRIESIFISVDRCKFPARISRLTYLQNIYLESAKIPTIHPAEILCDSYCAGYRLGRNLYRDDSHLSIFGARVLKSAFAKELAHLLNQGR